MPLTMLLGKSTMTGTTGFVDDLAVRQVASNPEELISKMEALDEITGSKLNEIGISQNKSKEENVFQLTGKGSETTRRELMVNEAHGITLDLKYLGSRLSHDGAPEPELEARFSATEKAFQCYWRFWSVRTDLDFKALMFRSIVIGTMLSGLIAYVFAPKQFEGIDSKLAGYARRAMVGWACDKTDGHHALSNLQVRKRLKFAHAECELRVLRLKQWQRVSQVPDWHEQLLAAMFGEGKLGEEVLCKRHARHVQLQQDFEALEWTSFDAQVQDILAADPSEMVTNGECREVFAKYELTELRQIETSAQIPPLGWVNCDMPEAVQLAAPNLKCGWPLNDDNL